MKNFQCKDTDQAKCKVTYVTLAPKLFVLAFLYCYIDQESVDYNRNHNLMRFIGQ